MVDFLTEYGLFLAKSVTVLVVVVLIVGALAGAAQRQRRPDGGRIETRRLNLVFDDLRDALRQEVLTDKELKKLHKSQDKERKQEEKDRDQGKQGAHKRRVWVLHFDGDIQASAVASLRNEVSAVLTVAEAGDEVLVCVESPGGMVHGYGLAASQLHRIRKAEGISLTVAVDKVAASGGYLMAVLGEKIIAAPFALLGSIGVVAQVPNVHRLLKKNDVDVEVLTAGEFKRTLTVFGENTEEGRAKFIEELEDVHALFKEFVAEYRPSLDLERVATGEAWHGTRALDLNLVDELKTSDEYIMNACEEAEVIEIRWVEPRSPIDRLMHQGTDAVARGIDQAIARWRDGRSWTR